MVKRDGNGSCVWFVTLKNEMAHVVYKYYGSITKLRGKKIRTEGIMINFVFVIVKYKTNQENLQERNVHFIFNANLVLKIFSKEEKAIFFP